MTHTSWLYSVVTLESVDSTNSFGLNALREGHSDGVWYRALSQSSGRGRRGRKWLSKDGNLLVSLTLKFEHFCRVSPQLCFVAALALRRAVLHFAPELALRVGLKWPNDLMLDGLKFSGILVEGELFADGRHGVVIGWGVNVESAPQLEDRTVVCLADYVPALKCEALLEVLMVEMKLALEQWNLGQGFDFICHEWRKSAIGMGQRVVIDTDGASFEALMHNLDASGQLVVLKDDGTTFYVNAGDVTIQSLKN